MEMLQGVWIFVAFVLCNPNAMNELLSLVKPRKEADETQTNNLMDDHDGTR